jgi:glycerol uptake facilitator protein
VTPSRTKPLLPAWFVGESVGTFILVFFGCGSVASAVLTGAQMGIFQVAIVWGIAISTAIYLTASLSGAHLNPAVTLAFAVWSDFRWRNVPRHLFAQCVGAFAASAALYGAFHGVLRQFEAVHHITRGAPGSEASAMIFAQYFPNPGGQALTAFGRAAVSPLTAFGVEALGTAILMLVIFCSIDERNGSRPQVLTPVTIGLTVTILISILGPLTQAGFNPTRDLIPRLFSAMVGWGAVPFTANGLGWLTVYVVAPVVGAVAGGGLYHALIKGHYHGAGPKDAL